WTRRRPVRRNGSGPMVTSAEVAELRRWNFGMRVLREPHDVDVLLKQIRRYNTADAGAVTAYIRQHGHLSGAVDAYSRVYDEVMHEELRSAPSGRLIARHIGAN